MDSRIQEAQVGEESSEVIKCFIESIYTRIEYDLKGQLEDSIMLKRESVRTKKN